MDLYDDGLLMDMTLKAVDKIFENKQTEDEEDGELYK